MFLQLVGDIGVHDPALAKAALEGLRAYQAAPPPQGMRAAPAIAEIGGSRLTDHGGDGPPLILVPSLINPPLILDLDPDVSLTAAIAAMGHRALLVDWGPASARSDLDVAGHIEQRLLPLIDSLDRPPVLLGYCLGGTMAMAAAALRPLAGLITLAAPWDFSHYPATARTALESMWRNSEGVARRLGALPMEVLQAAFWSLDPERTVAKFAHYGTLDPASPEARRFVELEECAIGGEALPYPAADELIHKLFRDNASGRGTWSRWRAHHHAARGLAVLPCTPPRTVRPRHWPAGSGRIGWPLLSLIRVA